MTTEPNGTNGVAVTGYNYPIGVAYTATDNNMTYAPPPYKADGNPQVTESSNQQSAAIGETPITQAVAPPPYNEISQSNTEGNQHEHADHDGHTNSHDKARLVNE